MWHIRVPAVQDWPARSSAISESDRTTPPTIVVVAADDVPVRAGGEKKKFDRVALFLKEWSELLPANFELEHSPPPLQFRAWSRSSSVDRGGLFLPTSSPDMP